MAGGFMSGFGPAFASTFKQGIQAGQERFNDRVKTQLAVALEKKSEYEKAKQQDTKLIEQAKLIAGSVPNAPDEAWKVAYQQLKMDRKPEKILEELRKGTFNKVEAPEKPEGVAVPETETASENLQSTGMENQMQGAFDSAAPTPTATTTERPKAEEAPVKDETPKTERTTISSALADFRKSGEERREKKATGEVLTRLGMSEDEYSSMLAGYNSDVDTTMTEFTFTPASVTDSPDTIDKQIFANVKKSPEYLSAMEAGDFDKANEILRNAKKGVDAPNTIDQQIYQNVIQTPEYKAAVEAGDYKAANDMLRNAKDTGEEDSGISFGNSAVGGLMEVWATTSEGKAALSSGNTQLIAETMASFTSKIDSAKDGGSSDAPELDMDKPEEYFYTLWSRTEEGKDALEMNDTFLIQQALLDSAQQAATFRQATNQSFGFDPKEVTNLNQIPGLRQQYSANPTILGQIEEIETALKKQAEDAKTKSPPKLYRLYGTDNEGFLQFLGNGEYRADGIYIANERVEPSVASKLLMADLDSPIANERIAAADWIKKKSSLIGSMDFADASLTYIANLERVPNGRTWVAQVASGITGLDREIQAAIEASSFVNSDGEQMVDANALNNYVITNEAFKEYSAEVRQLMAQELSLPFMLAKAQGNTGTAMSNQDYNNNLKSLFNSKDPEVVKNNILRVVYGQVNSNVEAARGVGKNPGMRYVVDSNEQQWWNDPLAYALQNRTEAVGNFVQAAYDLVRGQQEASSFGSGNQQEEEQDQGATSVDDLRNRLNALTGGGSSDE